MLMNLVVVLSLVAVAFGAEPGDLDSAIDAALARDNPAAAEDAPKV
jgi:hypothetical protein